MQRTSTTVIAVVGELAVDRWGGAANVRALHPDPHTPALDRAVSAWGQAARTTAPYTLHDADPLAAVAEAWIRRYDGRGPAGELEVAVAETVARWRARSLELPDYYLVVDPETWDVTRRHWYLGYLAGAAPARVVATDGDLLPAIAHLATGRWWPDLDVLLAGVDRVVPDRAGASMTPGDPLLQVGLLRPDGGVVTVPRVDDRRGGQDEQPPLDRGDDRSEVGP